MNPSLLIEINNLQNKVKIKKKILKQLIHEIKVVLEIKEERISFVFVDNQKIIVLNKKYFNKDCPTDVISFPLKDKTDPLKTLGEVVISTQKALENAEELEVAVTEELVLYIIHGILHLLGYKDFPAKERKKMKKKEERILFVIKDRYKELIEKTFIV